MKLYQLLKYFDLMQKVRIWIVEDFTDNEDDEPTFEGSILDVPYYLMDCKLVTEKELEKKYNIDSGIRSWKDTIHLYVHG